MVIRITNRIFSKDNPLPAIDLKIYCCIVASANRLHNAVISMERICDICNIASRTTVQESIARLCQRGLITKYRRRRTSDGYLIANGYYVEQQPGGWFELDTQNMRIFFDLDKSPFATLLYVLKYKRARSRRVSQSYERIARAIGSCRKTVIEAIKLLVQLWYIKKHRPERAGRRNTYSLFTTAGLQPGQDASTKGPLCLAIIASVQSIVKPVFSSAVRFLARLFTRPIFLR